jgi:BirA family biotin operon repressor/biotin-[acetyl-CoA-carboxylase] ligase
MPGPLAVLDRLIDGRFHSGGELGSALGVARTTVWTYVRELQALGLDIYAVRGRGYQLAEPLERLDAAAIRARLAGAGTTPPPLHVLDQVDSTNAWLKGNAAGAANGTSCLAERQSAGRGRRGRSWHSPFGRNLYLSLLWRLPARAVSGLSIAVGVAVAEACESLGAHELKLKWPNDIVGPRGKLGGILTELATDRPAICTAIIGIGLNVNMPARLRAAIDQPVSDLNELAGRRVSRNALAAAIIERLAAALPRFELEGLAPFRARFAQRDASLDRNVTVEEGGSVRSGHARGIDEHGALLLETAEGMALVQSGDVSLRAAS